MTTRFHVVDARQEDGERLPILLDLNRQPIFWPNHYLIKIRRSSVASSTLRNDLLILGYLWTWAQDTRIDLMARLLSGNGLTSDEISSQLFRFIRQDFSSSKVKKLVVARETVDARMITVRKFMIHFMSAAKSRIPVGDKRLDHIDSKIASMLEAFNEVITNIRDHEDPDPKLGLDLRQQQRLLEIITPGHPENPWQLSCQERNYLIVVMLLTFGIRRGELLKLQVGDCILHGAIPEVRVVRRPDDPDDPRDPEPNVKTEARALPCDVPLAQRINAYIMEERRTIPGAKKCKYLILARDGQPMSNRRINGIFEELQKKHPAFVHLHPHLLRHTASTNLRDLAVQQGIPEERWKQHLKVFNGWLSDQSGLYTQASVRREIRELSMKRQKQLFTPLEDIPF